TPGKGDPGEPMAGDFTADSRPIPPTARRVRRAYHAARTYPGPVPRISAGRASALPWRGVRRPGGPLPRQPGARQARAGVNRPHIRAHETPAALRFMHRGDAQFPQQADGFSVRPGVSTFSGQGAYRNVGQVVNLRPIVNRPGAGPWKLFRCSRQHGRYRVPLDVMNHALKLRIVANQPIIALILPEWLASESQHSVALPGSESFERLHHLGNCLQWSHQEMNVVRHNDKRMELIGPLVP